MSRELWEQGKLTATDERNLFDQGEITECEYEFGPHQDHDDCERMLDEMSGAGVLEQLEYEQQMYGREAEEEMLGRPLFPNEY